ncbi:MAG: SMP-30/gluconolactonase/LRE family protein, partial [Kiritimatiellia bacterium]|nr:SMP-30/gluconolactonase/LRE family protein [Kiritimatiellia bacterium]
MKTSEKRRSRILILGDSISIGYTESVARQLADVAIVTRNEGNAADTGNGLARLDEWLGKEKWDLIHFNFGLHDLKYVNAQGVVVERRESGQMKTSVERYAQNLDEIVQRLRPTGARLVFATTTPVPEGVDTPCRDPESVPAYNAAACRVMARRHVPVNDLYAFAQTKPSGWMQPRNVHFTEAGYEALAVETARRIRLALNLPDDLTAECVGDASAELGEGALWHPERRKLYWVDIPGKKLLEFDPATGNSREWDVGHPIGTVVSRAKGGLLLALQNGLVAFDPDTGKMDLPIVPPGYDSATHRFNDGKCDPGGRFWVGSMGMTQPRKPGVLYRLDPDGSMHEMLHDVATSNGIVWRDDRMYFIDTPLQRVDAFDYNPTTGEISCRRTAFPIPVGAGRPDGSTLDAEGMLWVAHWEGWRVSRWNPRTGELLRIVRLPVERITSCAFGGPELDQLFITTARVSLTAEGLLQQPLAGRLFRVEPGVRG